MKVTVEMEEDDIKRFFKALLEMLEEMEEMDQRLQAVQKFLDTVKPVLDAQSKTIQEMKDMKGD